MNAQNVDFALNNLKTGPWNLSELSDVKKNGLTVFSCFCCGGGSTMGYKLAGFEVLGGVEIDKKCFDIYKHNHKPKYGFLMSVKDFNALPLEKIPKELFSLDILDGSPPCSSFSMSGSREADWGKKKKFREGQADQVLDELFFDFIKTAEILKPKIVVAENVKGIITGKAKGYVKEIISKFNSAGYETQIFLLNAAFMGVPQKRERVFFVAKRKDLNLKKINLEFNEKPISILDAMCGESAAGSPKNATKMFKYWRECKVGSSFNTVHENKTSYFNHIKLNPTQPAPTLSAGCRSSMYHWDEWVYMSETFIRRIQTFPDDFNFLNNEPGYICGMSVPPFMMQRIANEIKKLLLN